MYWLAVALLSNTLPYILHIHNFKMLIHIGGRTKMPCTHIRSQAYETHEHTISCGSGGTRYRTNCAPIFSYSSISSISLIVAVDLVTFSASFAPSVRRCRCVYPFSKSKTVQMPFFESIFGVCQCLRCVWSVCMR